ncbi:MAG: hypothetical protein U0Z75_09210 [Deinococcaceae bacterium]
MAISMVLLKPFKLIAILTLTVSLSACTSTQQEKSLPQLQPSSFAGIRGMTPKDDFVYGLALSPTGDRLYFGGSSDGLPGSDNLDAFVGSLNPRTGFGIPPFPIFQKSGQKPKDREDEITDIEVGSPSGSIFVSGSTESSIFFEPNTSREHASFFARLNENGGTVWHHQTPLDIEKIQVNTEMGQEYLYVLLRNSSKQTSWIQKYNADTGTIVETYTPWLDAAIHKSFENCKVKIPDAPNCALEVEDFTLSKTGQLYALVSVFTPYGSSNFFTLGVISYETSGLFYSSSIINKEILSDVNANIAIFEDPQEGDSSLYISYTGSRIWASIDISRMIAIEKWPLYFGKLYNNSCHNIQKKDRISWPEKYHHLSVDQEGSFIVSTFEFDSFATGFYHSEPVISKYNKRCELVWRVPMGESGSGIRDLNVDKWTNDIFVAGNSMNSDPLGGLPNGQNDLWINRIEGKTGKIIW